MNFAQLGFSIGLQADGDVVTFGVLDPATLEIPELANAQPTGITFTTGDVITIVVSLSPPDASYWYVNGGEVLITKEKLCSNPAIEEPEIEVIRTQFAVKLIGYPVSGRPFVMFLGDATSDDAVEFLSQS